MSGFGDKASRWRSRVQERVLTRDQSEELGVRVRGGAELGLFPLITGVRGGQSGFCAEDGDEDEEKENVLLEVNETPVAGLTVRDVMAVLKHCKDPIRLKWVRPGRSHQTHDTPRFLNQE